MKENLLIRENNDKSPLVIFDNTKDFTLWYYKNNNDTQLRYFQELKEDSIQIFFSLEGTSDLIFHSNHCRVNIKERESSVVYFKKESTNIVVEQGSKSHLLCLWIPIKQFHDLLSSNDGYGLIFENVKLGKPIIDTKRISANTANILQQILTKEATNKTLYSLFVKGKIYELISSFLGSFSSENQESCPFINDEDTISQIKKIKDIIIENMANPPSLDELSKMVGLNVKKIKLGFKELYGMPVFTFLLNYKMDFAQKLLLENNNVSEVSSKLGYSTSSHFIAAFKKKFGITPKQYTKQEN
ncbi:MAG: helix-turn-helix transcriptional regulator [Flavobacteriaceae bacterium]|nr:helix-turn-helix transcriptional regulator [Flavobacteriaceae bacterium]